MIEINRWTDRQLSSHSGHVLVDGTLDDDLARDLSQELLNTVRKFHLLGNLRTQVHQQESNAEVIEYLESLAAAQADLEEKLSDARATGKRLRIRSRIEFEVADDDFLDR